ncbi:MAG TPA: glycoside hydrolase family 2 TIM barrel-domain containing protein [Abditibacteriaceae bacterium]|jgi:hypothetical protein
MRVTRIAVVSLLVLLLTTVPQMFLPRTVPAAQAAPTETVYLSGTDKDHTVPWQFQVTSGRNSGSWTTIPVPSNWETKGFGSYTHGWNMRPEEKGLYKYSFTPPARWQGKNITIVFEGSMTDTEVKINGTSAGPIHQGGFYRFGYDVTPLIQPGKPNLLEVNVSKDSLNESINRAERLGDYWNFGGIYRPVYLEARPAQRMERTAINARADGSFSADVYVKGVTTADTLTARIQRLNGTPVGQAFSTRIAAGQDKQTLTTRIANPLLWTAETPNLYQVEIRLLRGRNEIHRMTQRFGFRTIEVRAGDGIYVNGRKVILKGTNRHVFWPDSGRATSPAIDRTDILLMKEMNNNAVRMSHYPPDQSFLDLCDSLGLYVLDEIAGWQKKYDTDVGAKLVAETVIRDVNHPSIIFWNNANEGGWNTDLDDDFHLYDPQKRPVLHPWSLFSGVQTDHYENYENTRRYVMGERGNNPFLPTEFLHALYDGGGGAGLNDYWNLMMSNRLGAGGFIWAFLDEGLVRPDRGGVIDTGGNNYPDGIVGPYREKEGSFYTIKDIWSPLQIANREQLETSFSANFNGQIPLVNHYSFTDTSQCRFTWNLINYQQPFAPQAGHTVAARGNAASPSIAPGTSGSLSLRLPAQWRNSDALSLTATDPSGREINTWVWPIKSAIDYKNRIVQPTTGLATSTEDAQNITMTANGIRVTISKSTGRLVSVTRNGAAIGLANGPTLAAGTGEFSNITHAQEGTAHMVQANYSGNLAYVRWRLHGSGWLQLDYKYNLTGPQDFMGVSFDYPEKQVTGVKWLGKGPYRVWKNRMRGVTTNVWSKAYNDTATGADMWKYPEFKGYHAGTYWAQLQTTQGPITMVTPDENLFLRLYSPRNGNDPRFTAAAFPAGDISFLDGIAPMGSKFEKPSDTGPEGAPNVATGDYQRTIYLYFGNPTTRTP